MLQLSCLWNDFTSSLAVDYCVSSKKTPIFFASFLHCSLPLSQPVPLSFLSRCVRTRSCDGKLSARQTRACPPPPLSQNHSGSVCQHQPYPDSPQIPFTLYIDIFNSITPSDLDLCFQYRALRLFCSPFDRSATRTRRLVQSWMLYSSRRIKASLTQVLEWRPKQLYCSTGVTFAFKTMCRVPPTGFQSTCSALN